MILFVSPKDIYDIRLRILRSNHPIESVMFPQDFALGSFHLGKFMNEKLVGIISFSLFPFPMDKEIKNCYQLRGMAIEKEFSGKGIGEELYCFSEKILLNLDAYYVWCNARTTALGFYEKQNFNLFGDEFPIEDAGPHYVMGKNLKN